MHSPHKQSAFTLIELIIVIAIIAILAAAIFVAVDPARRLNQSRNSRRSTDVGTMLEAIIKYQVDHEGRHIDSIQNFTRAPDFGDPPNYYMIGTCINDDIGTIFDHGFSFASMAATEADYSLNNCTALNSTLGLDGDVGGADMLPTDEFRDVNFTEPDGELGTGPYCLDLSELVTSGYIAHIPIDPSEGVTDLGGPGGRTVSRYYFGRDATGALILGACEPQGEGAGGEGTIPEIRVLR